jgi:beta-glucanase (GH16 family)
MKLLGCLIFAVCCHFSISQQIKFQDNFDGKSLDESKWKVESTLAGGHDWQFQWYVNDKENLFIRDGILNIKPTLTADKLGADELFRKKIDLGSGCTQSHNYGCSRTGSRMHILNPIRSASIQTKQGFKFGSIEIRAKLPVGDWLRPSIKLSPKDDVYGPWPRSGEIVLVEARGNKILYNENDESLGIDKLTTTVHYGPSYDSNAFGNMNFESVSTEGFNENFHVFKFDWSESGMKFFVDNQEKGQFDVKESISFWENGNFGQDENVENPWINGSPMAPFDQEFVISISLAVGGVSGYFSDDYENQPDPKPWRDSSQKAPLFFWRGKDKWYKTWTLSPDSANFQIDYVKILSQ